MLYFETPELPTQYQIVPIKSLYFGNWNHHHPVLKHLNKIIANIIVEIDNIINYMPRSKFPLLNNKHATVIWGISSRRLTAAEATKL